MITVAGIKSCDTCRKALSWLEEQGIAHEFHDLRADGLDAKRLAAWIDELGWETLLNRRSTTWRQLPEADKVGLNDKKAAKLIAADPTLIKRPVFETSQATHVGFTDHVKKALKK